jgi:hypothetical protein
MTLACSAILQPGETRMRQTRALVGPAGAGHYAISDFRVAEAELMEALWPDYHE